MKLKEFIRKVQNTPVIRGLLPVNQGMLFPAFTVTEGKLCLHFLCHRSAVVKDGLQVWPPELYFQFAYPKGTLLAMQDLHYSPGFAGSDFKKAQLLPPRTPEERSRYRDSMQSLEQLGDEILQTWDAAGAAELEAYNRLLERVLLPEQAACYRRLLGLE